MNIAPVIGVALLALPELALTAGVEPSRAESALPTLAAAPGGGMLAQLTLGLVVVLVLAVGLGWLLRRYALPRDGAIRVIGGLPLSNRERLLLVEVDETRLLLGITATQIQTLHVFAPSNGAATFQVEPLPPPLDSPHGAPPS